MEFILYFWSLVGLIPTFFILTYFYITRNFTYWKKLGVPEILPTPFFGNFRECLLMKKSPGLVIKDIYDQKKGLPYVGFYILNQPCLLVRDRKLIKNILIKDFNYFCDRYSMPDPAARLSASNLFFLKNPLWKIIRPKLTPIFTTGKLKMMFLLMQECANNLNIHLESLKLEDEGKTVEIKDVSGKFSTDLITSIAFGLNVNSLINPQADFRRFGKKIFNNNYFRNIEIFITFFFPHIARLTHASFFGKSASEFLRNAFWDTINHRIKSKQKRGDLIDILVNLKNIYGAQDFNGFRFDGDDLVAQAAIFFTGGFETTSTTISFALYELAVHSKLQDRLRKDILEALDKTGGEITYEMVMSLPYLDMVVSETLRMYPILSFLDRMAIENYKVPNSDLVIEKNMPIYISTIGLHYDPEYFPDPHKFDPERFDKENSCERPICVYFPFGEGPHSCIGIRLGLLQTKLAIFKILSKYELTPCEKTLIPMIIDPKITLTAPLNNQIFLNIRKLNKTAT